MDVEQRCWFKNIGWSPNKPTKLGARVTLVLVFGERNSLSHPDLLDEIRSYYPNATLTGCSTAGEIQGTHVNDDSVVITAIAFDNTLIKKAFVKVEDDTNSHKAGKEIAQILNNKDLCHVFVVSEGLHINGSELVKGITENLPEHIKVTGGMAADMDRFEETIVIGDNKVTTQGVSAIGFYGTHLETGCSSLGGWDAFGPERVITRSKGNILFELDGKSALSLYKSYLGEHAASLPATGLLFPLNIRFPERSTELTRTIISVNEDEESLTFAGNIPQGARTRLMKANFNRLVDGAADAARISCSDDTLLHPDLAILISCVGRKMILKQRTEEEVEAVKEVFGDNTSLCGFYSNGEISPFTPSAKCELHNQTMTVTTFAER